ncbi:hypothetical protein [Halobacillus sp. BBL2006]|uniref:hypothetical protein n=1 Tax=Halobacillus sp. BBL2006 TaxID=1543706 RepID=UPI000541D3AF|nr:hypothetical protein [Halobacillus sp. BBL2006]KHE72400.1 hypothetical protein LD39_04770 [Halobacillus sp. BBL2006]
MEYLFLLASLITVVGISFAANKMNIILTENQLTQKTIQSAQTRFFLLSAVTEIIPILLIVIAFANLQSITTSIHMYISIVMIVLIWLIALVKMWFNGQETIQRASTEYKQQVNGSVFISIAFLSGIPLASIFMLLNL